MTHDPRASITQSPGLAALRRWSMIGLVGGVAGLGLLGIGVILFAYDSELIFRILGTVAVLGGASLLTLVLTALAQRRLLDMWFFQGVLAGAAIHSLLDIAAIWMVSSRFQERAFVSSFVYLGAVILAAPIALAFRARTA